ncbi:MAG TPA: hypothetical protein VGH73_05330 [Thermoanaerobaculia bacterium]|jgi:hypothetical protein
MKRSDVLRLALFLLLTVALSGPITAQSTDRDHPTPLRASEITGDMDGSGSEYFYSFIAGPGELTIMVDVKSSTGQGLLNFELLDKNAATAIICCEYAQADGDGLSARVIKTVKLTNQQPVVLHVTGGKAGKGTYRIRLSGTESFEK